MKELDENIIVQDIAGNKARLKTENNFLEVELSKIGFFREGNQLVKLITNDADRKTLVAALIEMNALFSAGKDWSPAELVDYYYEQGIIKTPYKIISWRTPDDYFITVKGKK